MAASVILALTVLSGATPLPPEDMVWSSTAEINAANCTDTQQAANNTAHHIWVPAHPAPEPVFPDIGVNSAAILEQRINALDARIEKLENYTASQNNTEALIAEVLINQSRSDRNNISKTLSSWD